MSNKIISPAPDGQIALVCCSPDNLHTTKYDDKSQWPDSYTPIQKPEEELNVFNELSFKEALSCGFNVLMYPGSDLDQKWIEYTQRALDLCKDLGVKLIINSPILNYTGTILKDILKYEYKLGWPESYVKLFVNHRALGGWQIKDEPEYTDWHDIHNTNASTSNSISQTSGNNLSDSAIPCQCKTVLKNYQAVSKIDTHHIVYMNLAANYDSKWIGSHRDYGEYLDEYINTFNPPLLVFDHYPITQNTGTEFEVNRVDFYYYLNLFSEKSEQYGMPFWAHCLCLKHDTGGANYPDPTLEMMRFEAFSALAFGAQGLVFWKYKQDYLVYNEKKQTTL